MRRTKQWWAALEDWERAVLVGMERAQYHSGSGWNLPDGYSDCGWCSTPTGGGGLCFHCLLELDRIISKADSVPRDTL